MPIAPVMSGTILHADPKRVGKVVKSSIAVVARDSTGIAAKFDLAELDDMSAVAWLNSIQDWKVKLKYRQLLAQIRLAEKSS